MYAVVFKDIENAAYNTIYKHVINNFVLRRSHEYIIFNINRF